MAVDWIKMRVDLQTHPKVVRIMSALRADKFRVIGGLHAVWSVFDAHSEDGRLDGYTAETMDSIVGWPGLAAAMESVGWLAQDCETLVAPGFEEHNGKTAKRRAMETQRKKEARKVSALDADKKRSREEKRRVVNPTPISSSLRSEEIPPTGKKMNFNAWLDGIRASGEKAVSDYRPVWEYAERVGISPEWIEIAWIRFRERYGSDPNHKAKRYVDWRRVFLNAVEGNWFDLWYAKDGKFQLSTVGQQADLATREAA